MLLLLLLLFRCGPGFASCECLACETAFKLGRWWQVLLAPFVTTH
jgi:hypothetical protein